MEPRLFFETGKTGWEDLGGGVSRQIMGYDDRIMLVKVRFEKGAEGAAHKHPHVQNSYVAEGVFEVKIGEQTERLQSGDSFLVPPDAVHGVRCIEAGVLIDVFSPVRQDFIK
ncbi:MAG: cupin domain-containing protein [Mangrovibacterium sp.]|nr:cupin domain-containing protein [Mangrovibacterium sp.]